MNLNAMRIYIVTVLLAIDDDDDDDDDLCASVNAIARSRLPLHPCATLTTDRAIALDFLSLVYKCIRELDRASTPPGHIEKEIIRAESKVPPCVTRDQIGDFFALRSLVGRDPPSLRSSFHLFSNRRKKSSLIELEVKSNAHAGQIRKYIPKKLLCIRT